MRVVYAECMNNMYSTYSLASLLHKHYALQSTEAMTSQKTFFAFQRFGYHVSVEHDEKHPLGMQVFRQLPEFRLSWSTNSRTFIYFQPISEAFSLGSHSFSGFLLQVSLHPCIHGPNLVGIGLWGPEIWLHEYLISLIEISVNWPCS